MQSKVPFATDDSVLGVAEGEYTRYPGLPENETRDRTLTFITKDIPSAAFFHDVDRMFGEQYVLFQYTLDELTGMRHGLPSTFHRIASLFPNLFPDISVSPYARMLQIQTELQSRVSTTDAAIIHSRRTMDTATSKIRTLLRIGGLSAGIGIHTDFSAHDFAPYTEDRIDDILIGFKREMIGLYNGIEWPLSPVPTVTLEERLTPSERVKFGYRDWMREALGDNLVAIGVYGSSTQTDDIEKYDDYDNWVVVRDLDSAYTALRATKPKYDLSTGRIHTEGKHLGILLFPSEGKMLSDYMRFLDDSEEFRTKMKIIHGSLTFPITSPRENTERGISQSYVKAKTTADAVANFLHKPEQLLNKNLFEFFVKIVRFNYKNAIRYHEGIVLTKEELDKRLRKEHGIGVPKYREDAKYLVEQLIYARQCTAYIQRELFKGIELRHEHFTGDMPRLRAA